MIVASRTEVVGSVSGGCLENAVIDEALNALEKGAPRVLEFGASDELAWSVGLTCGGTIRVVVEPFPGLDESSGSINIGQRLLRALETDQAVILTSSTTGTSCSHRLVFLDGSILGTVTDSDQELIEAALDAFSKRKSTEVSIGEEHYFLHVLPRKERLLIIGATDIAVSLVKFAAALNFETVVVDPRKTFATEKRFDPVPDRIIDQWPQQVFQDLELTDDTFAVVLTHDPKIDDPALHALLNSNVPYIGALGSRQTQKKRRDRLCQSGFDDTAISRIHGPVGLDISAATPAEIALSIVAQIIRAKNERTV